MKKVIARVKLNPGQGGYFDPITRIHLTHGDPERDVYAGMNTEGLRQAIRNKRISLVSGSLGEFVPPFKLVKQADGKIVLVANNQKKNVQKNIPVKKADISTKTVEPKKEEVKLPEKPVIVEEQKSEAVAELISVTKETEKPLEPVTVEPQAEVSSDVTDGDDIAKESVTEEPKGNNPFKKNKKKGSSKGEDKEQKN